MSGFIGLSRGIMDHWIYQDAEYLKVWIEMLFRARYAKEPERKMIEGVLVEIEYSQFIFGRNKWSERLGISERRLRTLMDKLIADDMIQLVKRAPKFSVYCVTNYAKYRPESDQQETLEPQGFEDDTDQQSDRTPTSKRPANDQQTTTKEQSKQRKQGNKETKKEYADYVFLTETEYGKLTELLGDDDRDQYFLRFASWISGKTKREQQSRSAYLSILNWHREDQKKLRPFPQRQQTATSMNKWDRMLAEEEAKKNGTSGYHQTGTDLFG